MVGKRHSVASKKSEEDTEELLPHGRPILRCPRTSFLLQEAVKA